MLKREVTNELRKWRNDTGRKALVVRGARQVGKTFSIEHFCRETYQSVIDINFLENPSMKKIFSGDLDSTTIGINLSLYKPESRIIPGETCIFLDEIQECPEAITALKFLAADRRWDVLASGSMLGIDYKRPTSYPVGSICYVDMFPLNFREFLRAAGVTDDIIGILREHFDQRSMVPWAIHDKVSELFRLYIILGGMPEVVSVYLENKMISEAERKVRDILTDYRYDIAHYASPDMKIKAEECYFSIPNHLSNENHKFMYSKVVHGGSARKFASSLDWIEGAYLAKRVYNVSGYDIPLAGRKQSDNFRVYPTDIGLLMGMYNHSVKEAVFRPEEERLNSQVKGGIYEAAVADMLIKNGHSDIFFRKNEKATFEIEFLIEKEGNVIPIEVKAGRSRSRSLDNLLKREDIPYGYKLIDGNVGVSGKKITLPLYMGMFL